MKGYNYSVERAEFAILNKDGSYPTPKDWTHTKRRTGATINHKGGLIGGVGPWNFSEFAGGDLKLTLIYGKNEYTETIAFTEGGEGNVVDIDAVTAAELAEIITAAFSTYVTGSVTAKGADYDAIYLKVIDAGELPWYAPFGFRGKIAETAEVLGWVSTLDIKSSNADPNTETGETVVQTSGQGNRCSIKEPNVITGKSLTITLAAEEEGILSMLYGDDYDPETGEYFEKSSSEEAPTFAYRVWVRRYPEGENIKSSNTQMQIRTFPSCSGTPGSSTDEEGQFHTTEIAADSASNSRSTLPMEFKRVISVTDYESYVSA